MNLFSLIFTAIATLLLVGCGSGDRNMAGNGRDDSAAHDDSHESGEQEANHVELTSEAARSAGIEVAAAGPVTIREALKLFGTVRPNAERVREVAARYPGVVQRVNVGVGDTVREGQTLAVIESNESLRNYNLTAPLSGVITARRTNEGESTGDTSLFTVADLSSVWVELSLFPRDLARVRVGQKVVVSSIDGGLSGAGRIVYIAQLSEAASQTLSARVALDNPQRRWAPGLYVSAEITLSESPAAVAVSNTALQTIEGRTVVFVRTTAGFAPQIIEVGRTDSQFTEVRSGLPAGTEYAAKNSFVLKSALGASEAGHDH